MKVHLRNDQIIPGHLLTLSSTCLHSCSMLSFLVLSDVCVLLAIFIKCDHFYFYQIYYAWNLSSHPHFYDFHLVNMFTFIVLQTFYKTNLSFRLLLPNAWQSYYNPQFSRFISTLCVTSSSIKPFHGKIECPYQNNLHWGTTIHLISFHPNFNRGLNSYCTYPISLTLGY